MITAKDIHRKKFEQVKFGYNPEEVEGFLAEVEQDFRLMEQQLSDSNDKVQLLADKVREYKDTEDDLRNALVGAQKQAREVIEAAKARAVQIESEARKRGDSVKAEAIVGQEEQLQSLESEIAARKQELAALTAQAKEFRQSLLNAYKTHLKLLAQIPSAPASAESAAPATKATESAAPAEKPAESAAPAEKPSESAAPAAKATETAAPAEKPAASAVPLAKPTEFAALAAKPAESAAPAEKPAAPAVPLAKPAESAAAQATASEDSPSHSSALINDPFAAEDAEKLRRNEMQFGSRRDDKRRRR